MMGMGKTMAAINMMNNSRDKKFIFITPYLDEIERIKSACNSQHFVSPEKQYKNGFSKLNHIHELMRQGRNIASTHALFGYYTQETIDLIKSNGYTLILDEVMDVVDKAVLRKGDLDILVESNSIKQTGERMEWLENDYDGTRFQDIMLKAKSNNMILYRDKYMFWVFPIEVFSAFQNVLILTYMFSAQVQKYYFEINNVDFDYIGVRKLNGIYQFCEFEDMDPPPNIKNKIHILNKDKLNSIGRRKTALSKNWFKRNAGIRGKPEIISLKNNIVNVFQNIYKSPSEENMWTCFGDFKGYLKGRGYSKGFASCNLRASNNYRNKTHLAYCVNIFFQPWKRQYFEEHGATVDEDGYALSEMVQWIFRSAIRDGKDIWIYVPSKRMRTLLINWLEVLSQSGVN